MTLHRSLRSMTLLGSAVLALAPLAVHAKPVPTSGDFPVFGSVDINKLQTQSTKKTKYDADLHALADRLNNAFKQQASSIMLSKAEQVELGGLLSKTNPTEADRNRITALQTQASKAATDLTDLQQKKDPTPADTERMAALSSQYDAGKLALQEVGDSYQEQLKTLSDKDNTEFTQIIKDAIAAVAQQRGLSVVFTSDVAVYTTNDITDEVVKRINK